MIFVNSIEESFEAGKPFPDGAFICAECDQKLYNEATEEGDACPVCETLMGGDCEGLSKHLKTEHNQSYEDAMTAWRQEHGKFPCLRPAPVE